MVKPEFENMFKELLIKIYLHVESEVMYTFGKKHGDMFDIMHELNKLEPKEFAGFGARITSLYSMLAPYEDFIKENYPNYPIWHDKLDTLRVVNAYYKACERDTKKTHRKG